METCSRTLYLWVIVSCAYASGKVLFPNDDIILLSIGTGRLPNPIRYVDSKRLGRINWIKPLLSIMFASSLDEIDYQLSKIMGDRYLRVQSQLKLASIELDDATPENIQRLQQEAQIMIE